MSLLQSDALQGLVQQVKAPISRQSIDEKVEVFERRLNGKILPFLGLHGMLFALIYLIVKTPVFERLYEIGLLLPAFVVAVTALFCGAITAAYHLGGRGRDIAGGVSVTFCLALVAVMLLPLEGPLVAVQLAGAVALALALLGLNGGARVADYEFNTVWLYLPLIFLVVGWFSGVAQMIAAVALYGPAIYVKFKLQPASNKVPLGISVLVFLSLIIEDNAEQEGMIAAMVVLVLVLFVIYSFRMRRVTGSSYRHFLADAIIMGLWALLVKLMDMNDSSSTIVWGVGAVAYQSITLLMLRLRAGSEPLEPSALTERDARLAWLQVGIFAVFAELVIESFLEQSLGIDRTYVGTLIIMLPFVPLFLWLRAPFLALSTRLWIGGCLIAAALRAQEDLEDRYTELGEGESLESLRADFLANWDSELTWVAFALLVALAATLRVAPSFEVAWWRGLVRARHMALIRRGARLVFANANKIAFIGGFISAAVALFNWIRYAGSGGGGERSREILLIGVHVFAVAVTVLFARYGLGCCDVEAYPSLTASPLIFERGDLPFVLACCLWGSLLYLRGVLAQDYLARFFATAFVVMPLATFAVNNDLENPAFFAQVALACCFALFGFGLFRRLAG